MSEKPTVDYIDIDSYEHTEYFTEVKSFILKSSKAKIIVMDIEAQKDKKYLVLDSEPKVHISERGLIGLNLARSKVEFSYPYKVELLGTEGEDKKIQYKFKVSKPTKQETL